VVSRSTAGGVHVHYWWSDQMAAADTPDPRVATVVRDEGKKRRGLGWYYAAAHRTVLERAVSRPRRV